MIEFLCPNGHRIHCPAEQAGRAAKCPKCGVKFLVPNPAEVGTQEGPDSPAPPQPPPPAEAPPAAPPAGKAAVKGAGKPADTKPAAPKEGRSDGGKPAPAAGPAARPAEGAAAAPQSGPAEPEAAAAEDQIEFLCPNGHRLHGPASLQGRPGECPQCGSRFRIPTYGPISDEEETEQDLGVGRADGSAEAESPAPEGGPSEHDAGAEIEDFVDLETDWSEIPRPIPSELDFSEPSGHPLAQLFARLWKEKPADAAIALHLSGGETLVPDHFAEDLSQETHAVFAIKEPGKTYTLTVVAWDSIVRVLVRGVSELPKEMTD